MSDPVFPYSLSLLQDSSKYSEELEDVALITQMEGGYVVSRAKHTRPPRRSFETGFTQLDNSAKTTLETFYRTVKGGSVMFDWTNPVTNEVVKVRFRESLKMTYVGAGSNARWDVSFKLEEV